MNRCRVVMVLMGIMAITVAASPAAAQLTFDPASSYTVTEVWSGQDGAHFAMEAGDFYLYGKEATGRGEYENVVRLYNGSTTVEVARTDPYTDYDRSPDAIAVRGGEVYWAHTAGQPAATGTVYKSAYSGSEWITTTLVEDAFGLQPFSLSTNGDYVFGVGRKDGRSVAFYLDDNDQYQMFADLSEGYSGGSGFDPYGNFFAGDYDAGPLMYEYSAQQVADRLAGGAPYSAADAIADLIVPSNSSAVMESNGLELFGTEYNPTYTGTNPYAYDLGDGSIFSLGVLSGADTTVSTDMYAREGAVYFMGKNDWTSGSQAVIYRLVPEPASLCLLLGGLALTARRRR